MLQLCQNVKISTKKCTDKCSLISISVLYDLRAFKTLSQWKGIDEFHSWTYAVS